MGTAFDGKWLGFKQGDREDMTKQFDEQPGSLTLSSPELARMIDISAVQAFHTERDIRELAATGGLLRPTHCPISCHCCGRSFRTVGRRWWEDQSASRQGVT